MSSAVVLEQTVAFPEPDHSPELKAQVRYEIVRGGIACPNKCDHGTDRSTLTTCNLCEGAGFIDVWAGVEEWDRGGDPYAGIEHTREVVDRQGSVRPAVAHSSRCVVPSHQEWSVEMFGKPRDYDSGKGCVHG